ncbi:radical SAM protein [Hymenobacter busanensis]|uniref:Radical SAM protein n=1 Tax=Hymenobacter busanensis TaxID=2607656 RepID=A0A7L4ZS54_9BACT|nr:radical SAM protein [Hymenobacter busanensis]KAA9327558.1 radical SAM protein [Hymenobacter busanensis]QHJ06104.1 radical SAM protein [Hymenobacter busanensis]
MPERPYTYYDFTLSLCPHCLRRIEAKIVFEDNAVYMLKRCPEHGRQKVRIASDVEYYKSIRNYVKPSEVPRRFNTATHYGCPYDCGLCADHEQHSCLTVVEITDRCNLTCPTCYAESSPTHGRHRTLEEVEAMIDVLVANEGEPDVVQISGGEPTLHPQFWEILDMCKRKPIKHLMVNTNGVRLAKDEAFVARLASYMPAFEVYLQFDSFRQEVLETMRGRDLRQVRLDALAHLNKYNLSTTLVATLQKGLNDDEVGQIIDFALQQRCVRGVTFQPTQAAGRLEHFDPETDRFSLTDVRQAILDQSPVFSAQDLLPVPCNPDALVMGYALKLDGEVFPLTRYIQPADLLQNAGNTIVYERDAGLRNHLLRLFSTANTVDTITPELNQILCCLPLVKAPELRYENLFRVIILQFMDAWNFDVRAVKKSCVHIISKDRKIIPFETMNIFYRDPEKLARLEELRAERV